jgi:Tfp pilus assembly protein PilF
VKIDYADAKSCATCHAKIAGSYAKTAMARSFSSSIPSSIPSALIRDFDHRASDTHFAMIERDGNVYQRRWQIGPDGKPVNIDEKSVDLVMGSGAHVRTFLHRTASGALQELPLAWYSENGGMWAMNPGYDQPNQPDSRRKIDYECMFCHNAYPQIPPGNESFRAEPLFSPVGASAIPEGIDCQRCHGPGRAHVESGGRAAIVNPSELLPDREMDVCAQCHLETSSFPLPHSIVKFDRGPFSYRPGEPLSAFELIFDQQSGNQDRFQIVSSVYRLKMSECYLKSAGALTCTTCHDPHSENHDAQRYNTICQGCHADLPLESHTTAPDCVGCHMPRRRTDDVVHAVMTDHLIQRRKPDRDLLAPRAEPHGPDLVYHGPVVPYDDPAFPHTPENDLYLALAQIRESNNVVTGLPQLEAAIQKYSPARAEFYIELADALLKNGRATDAAPIYKDAIERSPRSIEALLGLEKAYQQSGDAAHALAAMRTVAPLMSGANAGQWNRFGQGYAELGSAAEAVSALKKSLALDPEIRESHYALATLYVRQNQPDLAEAEYREAIRLQPDDSPAHMNFAILLFQANRAGESSDHFEAAIRYRPGYALGHYNYALMLRATGKPAKARIEMEQALRSLSEGLEAKTKAEAERILRELSTP